MRGTSGEIQPRRGGPHFKFLLAISVSRLLLHSVRLCLFFFLSCSISPLVYPCAYRVAAIVIVDENSRRKFGKRLITDSVYSCREHYCNIVVRHGCRRDHHQVFRRICIIQKRAFRGGNVDTHRRAVIIIEPPSARHRLSPYAAAIGRWSLPSEYTN